MMPSDSSEYLIAVVDDNHSVCRSVSRVLTTRGYRVETFLTAREYLDRRLQLRPTCLLADIRMPGLDGLAMHRMAHNEGDGVPTVFMTATGDISTVVRAMKAGASDLLPKPFSPQALLAAIDGAVDVACAANVEESSLADLWSCAAELTPREAEVAVLVATGRLNKQVAATLGITEKTVKVHRARAMRKLRAESLAKFVRIVDRIRAEAHRATVHQNGTDVARPAVVDVITRTLERFTATKA